METKFDTKKILEIIKSNPELSYEEMLEEARKADIPDDLFNTLWNKKRKRHRSTFKIFLFISIVLVSIYLTESLFLGFLPIFLFFFIDFIIFLIKKSLKNTNFGRIKKVFSIVLLTLFATISIGWVLLFSYAAVGG